MIFNQTTFNQSSYALNVSIYRRPYNLQKLGKNILLANFKGPNMTKYETFQLQKHLKNKSRLKNDIQFISREC